MHRVITHFYYVVICVILVYVYDLIFQLFYAIGVLIMPIKGTLYHHR